MPIVEKRELPVPEARSFSFRPCDKQPRGHFVQILSFPIVHQCFSEQRDSREV